MSKFKDKALSIQYAIQRLRRDKRSSQRNRRHDPMPLKTTHLDEYIEFRKKEEVKENE